MTAQTPSGPVVKCDIDVDDLVALSITQHGDSERLFLYAIPLDLYDQLADAVADLRAVEAAVLRYLGATGQHLTEDIEDYLYDLTGSES